MCFSALRWECAWGIWGVGILVVCIGLFVYLLAGCGIVLGLLTGIGVNSVVRASEAMLYA